MPETLPDIRKIPQKWCVALVYDICQSVIRTKRTFVEVSIAQVSK